MKPFCSSLCVILLVQPWYSLNAQTVPLPRMNVVVLEGDGAINNLRQRTSTPVLVQVRDGNRRPVPGAIVRFTLPEQGPSGFYPDGSRALSATADEQGRVTARGLKPNSVAGPVKIQVEASTGDQTASATITQFNMAGPGSGGGTGKWVALLTVVGAAAAGGIVTGLRNGGKPQAGAAPVPIGITPGSGSVGPPR